MKTSARGLGRRLCCLFPLCVLATGAGGGETEAGGLPPPSGIWWTQLPSFAQMIDAGRVVTGPMEYKLPSVLVDALRITDEAAVAATAAAQSGREALRLSRWRSALQGLGKVAGFLEFLQAAIKSYDRYAKEKTWNTAVIGTAVVEGSKWLLGNAAGGAAAAGAITGGYGIGWGVLAGWAAVSATEFAIDGAADLAATITDQHRKLPADERDRRSAADLALLKWNLGIPDDAMVVWKEDLDGRRVRETTWTETSGAGDQAVKRIFTAVTWYNPLGHAYGSDFDSYDRIQQIYSLADVAEFRVIRQQSIIEELSGIAPKLQPGPAVPTSAGGPKAMEVSTAPDVDLLPLPIPPEPPK